MDAYFVSPADARTLYESFKNYYKEKYGKTDEYFGFAAWAFKKPDGTTEQIELTDQSAEYRQGKFSLVMYYVPDTGLPKKPSK